jgi:eukaryotic-like serine/threonine-protein kinase
MNTPLLQAANRILAEVLEHDVTERTATAESLCDGNDELLRLVTRLAERALEPDPMISDEFRQNTLWLKAMTALTDPVALPVGQQLGPYRMLERLGYGGSAEVYLGEREEGGVRQSVAIKLLRMDVSGELIVKRFQQEQRILARLTHPNIGRVYDVGLSAQGRPYFVMEYVRGMPIDRYCDAQALSVAERVSLFVQVAQAVAHAHSALVIHRDIKPSNVLVDADGHPKLLDFGIAKLLSNEETDTELTATGISPATIGCASPEQLSGEAVSVASDVYQLGVLLYVLLAGQRPYAVRGLSREEAADLVRHGTHPAPSVRLRALARSGKTDQVQAIAMQRRLSARRLLRELDGDLDRIVGRAMMPEPAERYASVAQLVDDAQNYLAGRPVAARGHGTWYVLSRFLRRHAVATGAFVMLVAGLIAFSVVITNMAFELERTAQAARVEANKAHEVASFVRAILSGIDPDHAKFRDTTLLRELLEDAGRRAATDLAKHPAVLAAVEDVVAESYLSIGDYERALAHQHAAVAASHRGDSDPVIHADYSVSLAEIMAEHGDLEGSIAFAERVLAALPVTGTGVDTSRSRLEARIAHLECSVGRFQACYDRYARVLPMLQEGFGAGHLDSLNAGAGFAMSAGHLMRFEESENRYRKLIDIAQDELGPEHTVTLKLVNGLAVTHLRQKNSAEAERLFRSYLPVFERVHGPQHPNSISIANNLGAALRLQGRNTEARPYYERALASFRTIVGNESPTTVTAMHNLGNLLRDIGDLDAAEPLLRESVSAAQVAFGASSPNRIQMHGSLAVLLRLQKRYSDAERELHTAWQLIPGDMPRDHVRVVNIVKEYVRLYDDWNKPDLRAMWQARLPVQ